MKRESALPQGTLLHDRYEIREPIGTGGFGIIYRAVDLLLNSFVAVKEFFPEKWMWRDSTCSNNVILTEEEDQLELLERCRENFIREAGIMRALKNVPYIARIRDSFSENGTEYIVMNLLKGQTLMEYTKEKEGPVAPGDLIPRVQQILIALEQMHHLGFLHRDISPGNLFLTENRDLYLIDFGTATACDVGSELWNAQVFDHRGFEAPEHSCLDRQGSWTDIYSICASLVYLLTGEGVPDPRDRQQLDELPQILRKSALSSRQQNILLRGLQIQPERRCASAGELRRELCGELQSPPENWVVAYGARTDIGTRKVNQDNLMVDRLFYYEGEDFKKNGTIDCRFNEIHMAAVCDGVGGSNHGELASRATIQALRHFLENYGTSEALPERLIEGLLDQVNEKIIALGEKIGITATTVSLLLWKGNQFYAVNIGDSPIYLLRQGRLSCISTPHTRAQINLMSGHPITPKDRHTLMNYLGKQGVAGSQISACYHGYLQKGDVFLLCSDGVSNKIDRDRLKKYLSSKKKHPLDSMWRVLKRSRENDNCSAVILQF